MSPEGARSTEIVIEINGDRILIKADGYYPEIEAISRKVGAIMTEQGIGGCTLVEQPADVADTHENMHKAAASDELKHDKDGAPTDTVQASIEFLPTIGPREARLHTHASKVFATPRMNGSQGMVKVRHH